MPLSSPSEEIFLIRRVAELDQAALGLLYDRYARVMYSLAYKILGSVEEAEEVVLDVFAQVWRDAGRYDASRSRLDSWLFMITRSRSLDRLRRRQRQTKIVEGATAAAQVHIESNLPEADLLISERQEQVSVALSQLPQEQQQILELAYFQGLSQSEIAKRTGVKLGTVKTRIRLGLNKLRNLLERA